MDPIQITIILIIVVVLLAVLGYYWYDNAHFKRQVENNFSLASSDVIAANKEFILDGVDTSRNSKVMEATAPIIQKDSYVTADSDTSCADEHLLHDPILDNHHLEADVTDLTTPITAQTVPTRNDLFTNSDSVLDNKRIDKVIHKTQATQQEIPLDSAEAFFIKFDSIPFDYANKINSELDATFDVVFEEITKIKVIPELSQFTAKPILCFVLDKNDNWQIFEHSKKYITQGLKFVVPLVDRDGIVNHAQISNIYSELHRFVLSHNGHIRHSDYDTTIARIGEQVRSLENAALDLELYLVSKDMIAFSTLLKFFNVSGLVNNSGIFTYVINQKILFTLTNENHQPLQPHNNYNMLSIVARLHLHQDPLIVVDKIFDFAEKFMEHFEARLLTTNKQLLGHNEYDQLINMVRNYIETAKKKQVILGSDLILRLYS